jgi:glycosyltransferase involved in cell wall biosynthesis
MVAHRVGEVAQFVGDAGVQVAAGDVEGMGREVARLLGDGGERVRLGELARRRVWGEFSWEGLSERAEGAYKVVLGEQ